jgi:uncharacterized protein YkwD
VHLHPFALTAALLFTAPSAPSRLSTPTQTEAPAALDAKALQLETTGALADASSAWFTAGTSYPAGPAREARIARARSLDARLALRREITEAFPTDKTIFAELNVTSVTADSLRIAGHDTPWPSVPLDLLTRLSAAANTSQQARAGFVFESLSRGTPAQVDAALTTLAKLLDKRELSPADAYAAVARTRNEPLPPSGYIFRSGTWTTHDATQATAATAALEDLASRFETANASQRDALFTQLLALGDDAKPRLTQALETRWTTTTRFFDRNATLDALTQLSLARKDLDTRRKLALDLIFDEAKYFSPYRPPECPPDKARLYPAVQREVDELVGRVRDIWKLPRKVHLPRPFVEALAEIDWNRARQKELGASFATPPSLTDWSPGIDTTLDSIDITTFAWNAAERAALARNRAVSAFNARQFKRTDLDKIAAPNTDEQAQFKLTNDYRLLLGRCTLAWNPKLQTSAQLHSEVMANTGKFSHDEDDPARRTMRDRAKLAGYDRVSGENLALTDGAESAHTGWLHSSGHHRNILAATHREFGVAIAGSCWTQNFGSGNEYEKDLAPASRQ